MEKGVRPEGTGDHGPGGAGAPGGGCPQGDGHQSAPQAGAAPENSGGHPDPLDGRADRFPPDRVAEPVPPAEHGEPPDNPREAPAPRGPERASPREGPAARLRFEDEDAAPGSQPGKAAPKGPRPAGRGPRYSQDAPADAPPEAPMGQSVPRDGGGKFRQESNSEQAGRAKFRMEKREAKLDKARDKLAKQKPPKPKGPVRKIAGAAGWTAHGFVHSKIYENEHENVGIEGAHRSELVAEAGGRKLYRFARRKIRSTRPRPSGGRSPSSPRPRQITISTEPLRNTPSWL